jgi:predicted RNase H-like HicB family nuclease
MPITEKSKKTSLAATDRPFDQAILKKARHAAGQYGVILWQEEGKFLGSSIELPQCLGVAGTAEQCVRETRELMVTALATDLERGLEPPPPSSARRRTEQINIRVSPLERKRLEIAAESGGYNGISDYIRNLVLAES